MSIHPKKVENDTIPLQFVLNLYSICHVTRENPSCMLYLCKIQIACSIVIGRSEQPVGRTNNNRACNLNSRAFAWTLTARSGVCGVTDQRFHNSREMFEFYATKSCLFLLKAMYVMGNLSDIMDLLILWRLDALFGCGRANSEVDAWSGER